MKKAKVGDVFEIETSKGKAYLHYIYEDPIACELIRVMPGLYTELPQDLEEIVKMEERYMISFPLKAAYRRKIVERVGHVSSENYSKPAYMRTDHWVRYEFMGWHIVDTDTWYRRLVQELTPEQMKLSPWDIWNDTYLCDRLVEGWSLENWGNDYGNGEQAHDE